MLGQPEQCEMYQPDVSVNLTWLNGVAFTATD